MKKKLALILSMVLSVYLLLPSCAMKKTEEAPAGETQSLPSVENKTPELPKTSTEPTELVISTWAFNEDKVRADIMKPFEEANNVKITLELGNNTERLTKIKNDPNGNIDIVYLAESFSQAAIDGGLFEKLDYSKISNSGLIMDSAQSFVKSGFGPAYTLTGLYIMYDKEKVGHELTSWADLWDPSLKASIAIPDISITYGPSMIYIAGEAAGMPCERDTAVAAFEKLQELKPNIAKTYTQSSELLHMFASGEINVAVGASYEYGPIAEANPAVALVAPKEGIYLNFNTINILKSSKNKEMAYKFINYILSTETQERSAGSFQESPINKEVRLPEDIAKSLSYGEVLHDAKTIRFSFIEQNKASFTEQWNRIMK